MKIADAAVELEMKAQRATARQRDAQVGGPCGQGRRKHSKRRAAAGAAQDRIRDATDRLVPAQPESSAAVPGRQGQRQVVVTVTDGETGEVIRQVPGEEALSMAQRIEDMTGLLDEKA